MFYMFMALEDHFDGGFGATADAFKHAADSLEADKSKLESEALRHLPVNFLRRHACELYLKSGIVIVHRSLNVPYGKADPHGQPFVKTSKGWQPFHRVHTIGFLFDYWRVFLDKCGPALRQMTGDDWSVREEMAGWVALVDGSDPQSTLFRYPTTKNRERDRAKSPLKPIPAKSLMPGGGGEGFLFIDRVRNVKKAFRADESPLGDVAAALHELADALSHYHYLMRSRLTKGV